MIPTLALMWIPALAIAGGVLASGPIIIHILFRRRYRVVDFAAMRFLLDSMKRSKQRLRVEELIIIALRTLACIFLGLTLANIHAASPIVPGAHSAGAHVFILDESLSMGQRVGAATVFQKALTRLAETLRGLSDNDTVAIISGTAPESGKPLGTLSFAREVKREDFLHRLGALKPTDMRLRLPEALAAARRVLETQSEAPARIYLISDFRKTDFSDPQMAEQLRQGFAALPARSELVLLDYGLECKNNLTVEKIELRDKLAVAKVGTHFAVTIRNNGTATVDGANLTIRCGEITLPVIPLEPLAPGKEVKKPFTYELPTPGVAALRASVTSDSVPGDDTAALALVVYEHLRILIVDGSPNPAAPGSGSFAMARALDPSESGAFGQRVEVVEAAALGESDLERYDTVILTNVREFAAGTERDGKPGYPVLSALERYVRNGGGVAMFLGANANPDFYNGPLYANGSGLSPLQISPAAVPAIDPASFHRLKQDSIGPDPLLRIFAAGGSKFTQLVRFYAFRQALDQRVPLGEGAGTPQVLAKFDDKAQSPAVVRRTLGKGSVITWYTVPDTKWTDWHKDPSFLAVLNDMVWALAQARGEDLNGTVGQRISYTLPSDLADATSITVKTPAYPAEDLQALKPVANGRSKHVEFLPTIHAGVYEMALTLPTGAQRSVSFSRSIDPAEGNMAKATEQEISAAVGRAHSYVPNLSTESPKAAQETPRRSYVWIFLALLLAALGLELLLAQRFGHYAEEPAAGSRAA